MANHCILNPSFHIKEGKLEAFKAVLQEIMAKTKAEVGCQHFHAYIEGNYCTIDEKYDNAQAIQDHMQNMGDELLGKLFSTCDLDNVRICGPSAEVDKLREPMEKYHPVFLVHEDGFTR